VMWGKALVLGLMATSAHAAGAGGNPKRVDTWLKDQGLNKYGDSPGTMYAGGNPLFDERTGEMKDRMGLLAAKFPDKPWEGGGAAAAEGPTGDAGGLYPAHWGEPPMMQTKDYRPLPGGYGMGSGTLAKWIQANLDRDAQTAHDSSSL